MQIYGNGHLVYQQHSDEGVIEVVDEGDSRSLHFGTFPRQSTMRISNPTALELSYTQAMMSALLLQPAPKHVLVIGLGGGSLVKFLLQHYADCQITVVEYRHDVIAVAQRYFHVPVIDPRLTIHQADGYQFVKQCFYQNEVLYDLLLIDAYDHKGMAESMKAQDFFDRCAGILTATGVLSINLWGSERALFHQTMDYINQSFEQNTLILPVENKGNVIALASKFEVKAADLKQLKPEVEQLEMRLQVNLPKSLQTLMRQNRSFIYRLFTV